MLNNDRQITISAAGSRSSAKWPAQRIYLSEFYDRLRTPVRSTESFAEYLRLPKSQQDNLKDVGGFVGGTVHDGGRRKASAIDGRDLITLDLDRLAAGGTDDVFRRLEGLGCGYAVYSTRKHSLDAPRLRVLLPLDRTVTADEYEPIARKASQLIEPSMEIFDPTTFEASRLMYWPSCCSDSPFVYTYGDKPFLMADGMLGLYANWHNTAEWPEVPGVQQKRLNEIKKQGDPTEKTGVVGAFCRSYDIYAVMEKFLSGVYETCDISDRFTFTGGSTTGGAVMYDHGNFLYSHHATDPAGGKLCNAFDLVRLHRFGEKDDDAKPDTPTNRLLSFTAMCELAVSDEKVSAILNRERYENAVKEFENAPTDAASEPENWMHKLVVSAQSGMPMKTADNILIILENDPIIKGRILYDEFAKKGVVGDTLPWDPAHPGKRTWGDKDDMGARWYLEKVYGITGKEKVSDALGLCGNNHSYNEVKNYLLSLAWDGIPRLDRLFIDYLGAADTAYVRAVTRKSFVAAAARALEPGGKYDTMPILSGPQGLGKSTLLNKMGRSWFTDGMKTFEGKEAAELIQGVWIVEIGELEAFNKSEVGRIKQFLSQRIDRFRAAYGRHVQDCPRCCVFFGTSNNGEYLRDTTGGRRFWPIDTGITVPVKSVFKDLDDEIDQLWAEAVVYWRLGEPLYLSGELEKAAKDEQESHREHSTREGIIRDFLEQPVPEGWESWDLQRRLMYWSGGMQGDLRLVSRTRVCALEIWCEALGSDSRAIKNSDSAEINAIVAMKKEWKRMKNASRFGYCKWQRGFEKL